RARPAVSGDLCCCRSCRRVRPGWACPRRPSPSPRPLVPVAAVPVACPRPASPSWAAPLPRRRCPATRRP
ncbi:unnamed protein product, partial [Callosobruchus maculatus]